MFGTVYTHERYCYIMRRVRLCLGQCIHLSGTIIFMQRFRLCLGPCIHMSDTVIFLPIILKYLFFASGGGFPLCPEIVQYKQCLPSEFSL